MLELSDIAELLGAMLDSEEPVLCDASVLLSIEQALSPKAATAAIERSPTILRCVFFTSISLPRGPWGQPMNQTLWFGLSRGIRGAQYCGLEIAEQFFRRDFILNDCTSCLAFNGAANTKKLCGQPP
nr:hypothetical protein [Glutamicibacter uratoxydans]